MKKVIFLMIDSLMPNVLETCIKNGTVPALQYLKENGMYWAECTSVFPTMTASVDCSLITGEYPDKHKIPALIWYDPKKKKLINYTNGAMPVLKLGLGTCAYDVICALNDQHLEKNVSSIYEELSERGKTTGSINLIAHRGTKKYQVFLPFLLKLATKFKHFDEISGPDVFTLGSLSRSSINPPLSWRWDESIFGHYGINDAFAIRCLIHLIKHQLLPDFTMVYLPDNDHQVHIRPQRACQILEKVDKQLQKLFNTFPTWEEAIQSYVFIVTGDHGQTVIGKEPEHNIILEDLLKGMHIASYGAPPTSQDEVVIANNERMSYLYPLKEEVIERVVEQLAHDKRIDIIGWKESNSIVVRSGLCEGVLCFSKEGDKTDIYGNSWNINGNPKILDLKFDHNMVHFGEYPDVLSRLYGALFSQDTKMVACTAKPGYEFKSAFAPTHLGGGSHGSLHKTDSTIPLIVTGSPSKERPFDKPRLVDLKKYVLELLM